MERYYSLLEWLPPAHAACMLESMTGVNVGWVGVVRLCEEGQCPGYALRRPRGGPAVYRQVPQNEVRRTNNLLFKPDDIKALAAKMNGSPERPSTADVEALRRQLEAVRAELDRAKRQMSEPSSKSRNAYLRTIAALGHALIGGSTGQPHTDENAILGALADKGIPAPVAPGTLAGYLKQAGEI